MKISRGEFATRIPFAKKSCVFLSENHRKWSFDESPGPPEAAKKLPEESSTGQNFAASGGIAAVQGWLET